MATALLQQVGRGRSLDEGTTLRLQIVRPHETIEGTCFLIYKQQRHSDVALSFLTSARLFRAKGGSSHEDGRQLRLLGDGSVLIEPIRAMVMLSTDEEHDVAILRLTVPYSDLVPFPVVSDCPEVVRAFVAFGHRANGSPVTLKARVQFRSRWFVMGDRTAPKVESLVGAPAIVGGSVFGLVSDCGSDRNPRITRLSTAYGFIARNVPGWIPVPSTPNRVMLSKAIECPATYGRSWLHTHPSLEPSASVDPPSKILA